MSKTRKGTKPPGWEPWSNREERQKPAPDKEYWSEEELLFQEEIEENYYCFLMGGCSKCSYWDGEKYVRKSERDPEG